jgi:hypothetical protein
VLSALAAIVAVELVVTMWVRQRQILQNVLVLVLKTTVVRMWT